MTLTIAPRIDRRGAEEATFWVKAIVALPNHLHSAWSLTRGAVDFPTGLGSIKAYVTRRFLKTRFIPTTPVRVKCGEKNLSL